MEKRAILLIVDSLGIGAMTDVATVRPQDLGSNTFGHILSYRPELKIPNLKKLGIGSVLDNDNLIEKHPLASYGRCALLHEGADSYLGHQEIMGTKPLPATKMPFANALEDVKCGLEAAGYKVIIPNEKKPFLLVEDAVVVADNIETDYGQIYNVTGAIDVISFDEIQAIGKIVRDLTKVNRVIALGGEGVSVDWILSCVEQREDGLIGVNSPKSGVYQQGYQVRHLGLGLDPEEQVQSAAIRAGKEVVLIGKMQDVIVCEEAKRVVAIETSLVLDSILAHMETMTTGLIAATVQETDLAGHAQDVALYADLIERVDEGIGKIMEKMTGDDLLIISADHGNDPCAHHSQHTRENTFLLSYQKGHTACDLGTRKTLSDMAASIATFLEIEPCKNGTNFI
ncbi:phosphopentomutase [Fusibacter ferrireducens]|uniref:Phosphopentomutase n=1 Tax=Fusibacter ferrireducens TaxID=2785058 RepID=A0ABR9ZXL7_9FIRM|nr:phosphopentomutase [Fusibacter ferrireducens]MBF4695213.1 phosphopentomutase [Fusibacter ferrireducens]